MNRKSLCCHENHSAGNRTLIVLCIIIQFSILLMTPLKTACILFSNNLLFLQKEQTCNLCGIQGHVKRMCPNEICYNCMSLGHRSKVCQHIY